MVVCKKCIYYYVTWNEKRPHGCKAYGFQSAQAPWAVVKRSSGKDCMMFKSKDRG